MADGFTIPVKFWRKSLEEEISAPSCSVTPTPAPVVDLASESGESQPDLGYLLEASDDEFGLPPSNSGEDVLKEEETELVRVESGSSGIVVMLHMSSFSMTAMLIEFEIRLRNVGWLGSAVMGFL
ncbi:uncharacterized protein LOC133038049 [Cannabis sativa]|uniref:uncharacterized protein LOC133038049 n=1 Tax=Cannabis sativa TaxID=3483 RepID=UPI0029CA2EDB|nr:uncharacterized protein LOC133038049 [Cannabis sativa]